jgi:hypothetical protein
MPLNFAEYVSSFFSVVVEYLLLLFLIFSLLLLIILLQTIFASHRDDYRILVLYLGKMTLCLIIVGLYGLLYFIINPIAIIACCIASIYFLFNGYDIYIGKKILRLLYKNVDGEYIIISDSKLLFWLPLFWTEAIHIIGVGIKAKKNGDYSELSGINGKLSNFRFNFCKNSEYFDFNQFGILRNYSYNISNDIIYVLHKNRWLFVQVNYIKKKNPAEDYNSSGEHSHNHLMRIYFGDKFYSEFEKIIYNIITQTDENKVIDKYVDEYSITEYYYINESSYISKELYFSSATFYTTYRIYGWEFENFRIEEFMQLKDIHYKINDNFSYHLNENYFFFVYYFKYELVIRLYTKKCEIGNINQTKETRMSKKHNFNLEGGEYLTKIGATWFVSYSFHLQNKEHMNWKKNKTYKYRISVFNKTKNHHKSWLQEILKMDAKKLNTNEIELDAEQVKQMVKTLLNII